jgi:hypothetical protein
VGLGPFEHVEADDIQPLAEQLTGKKLRTFRDKSRFSFLELLAAPNAPSET